MQSTGFDVHKDYVATGGLVGVQGAVNVFNWKRRALIQGTENFALFGGIACIRFNPEGNVLAAASLLGQISIYSFRDERLDLLQYLVGEACLQASLDMSGDHIISCQYKRINIYRLDKSEQGDDCRAELIARPMLDAMDPLISAAILRSTPGIAVTTHTYPGPLKVWDLERGALLREFQGAWRWRYLSEVS